MISRRWLLGLPLGVAALGGIAFWRMLGGMEEGSFDPHGLPSTLIGKTVPDFNLPAQAPSAQGFSSADLRQTAASGPLLVNFFASWCVPCIEEHDQLMALRASGLPIWGIAYKDQPAAAADFIQRHGNPFQRIAADAPGLVAIDFGVYGVPENYLLDRAGIVRWRWAGAITAEVAGQQLQPLLRHYA